jgi:hypothetical protein
MLAIFALSILSRHIPLSVRIQEQILMVDLEQVVQSENKMLQLLL